MATPTNPLASSRTQASSPPPPAPSAPAPSSGKRERRGAITAKSSSAPPSGGSSSASGGSSQAAPASVGKSKAVSQSNPSPYACAYVKFTDLKGTPLPKGLYLYVKQTGSSGDFREYVTDDDGKVRFLAMAELNQNKYVAFKDEDAEPSPTVTLASRERSQETKYCVYPSWERLKRDEFGTAVDKSALVPGWASKRFLDFSLAQERTTSGAVVFKVVVPTKDGIKLKFTDKNGRPLPKGTWISVGADSKAATSKIKPFREFRVGDAGALQEVDLEAGKGKIVRDSLSDVDKLELEHAIDGFEPAYAFHSSARQLSWVKFQSTVDDDNIQVLYRGIGTNERVPKEGEFRLIKLEAPVVEVRARVFKKGATSPTPLREGLWLYVGRKGSGDKYEVVREFKVVASGRLKEVDLVAETGDTRAAGGSEVSEFKFPHTIDGAAVTYAFKAFPDQLKVAKFEEAINARDATLGVDFADPATVAFDGGVAQVQVPVAKGCRAIKALAHAFDDSRQKRSDQPADGETAFEVETDGTEVPILAVMVVPTDVNGFKFEVGSDTIGEALDDPKGFFSKMAGQALSTETKAEKDEEEKKKEGWSFGVEAGWTVARADPGDVVEVEWVGTHDECTAELADRPPKVIEPTGARKPKLKQRSTGKKDWLVPLNSPDRYPTWVPSFAPNMKDIPFGDGRWVASQRKTDPWHAPRVYKVQALSCRDPSQVVTIEVHSLPCWGAVRAAKLKPVFNTTCFSIPLGPFELKMKATAGGASIEQFVGWKIDDAVGRIARESKFNANFGEITLTLEFSILSAVTGIPKALLDYIADIALSASLGFGLSGEIVAVEERKYLTKRTGGGPGLSPTTERYVKGSVKAQGTFAAKIEAHIGPRILKFEASGTVKTALTGTYEYSTEGVGQGEIKRKKSVDREAVKLILAVKVTIGWIFTKEKAKEWVLMKRSNLSLVEEVVRIDSLNSRFAAGIANTLVALSD